MGTSELGEECSGSINQPISWISNKTGQLSRIPQIAAAVGDDVFLEETKCD
jgi:hypothetical protein